MNEEIKETACIAVIMATIVITVIAGVGVVEIWTSYIGKDRIVSQARIYTEGVQESLRIIKGCGNE